MPDWRTAQRRLGSRWNSPALKSFVPGISPTLPPCQSPAVLDACALRTRLDEVQYLLSSGRIDTADASVRRSPEPAPVYDAKGVRINSRERLATDKLVWERQALVQLAQKIHPQFRPPHDFRMQQQQLHMKIYIPFKEYPDYNFIGLIIGPRGLTQKQMERDTGCKIAIRGRGGSKDGKQMSNKDNSDDPLHVLITAPNMDAMRKAESLVRKLVTPVEETQNEHKRAQLRKLAEINGTLMGHEESFSRGGGGPGGGSGPSAGRGFIGCINCGAPNHPTYDCIQPGNRVGVPNMSVREYFDMEYASFCVAVGERVPDPSSERGRDAAAAMESFYEELNL